MSSKTTRTSDGDIDLSQQPEEDPTAEPLRPTHHWPQLADADNDSDDEDDAVNTEEDEDAKAGDLGPTTATPSGPTPTTQATSNIHYPIDAMHHRSSQQLPLTITKQPQPLIHLLSLNPLNVPT